jgi:membrane protease YdiL (CAAX protease family)
MALIARAGSGPKSQVLWSSLAFGVAHVMWGPVGMLFTVFLAASFAVATLWRGNVWAAVTAHTLLNLCIEPGLMEKAMAFAQRQ